MEYKNLKKVADFMESALRKTSASFQIHGSNLSDSVYIEFGNRFEGDADDPLEGKKIRIADHALPPTYGKLNGYADWDVAVGYCDGDSVSYETAIRQIYRIEGIEKLPVHIRNLERERDALRAEMAAWEAARAAEAERQQKALEARMTPELSGVMEEIKAARAAGLPSKGSKLKALRAKRNKMLRELGIDPELVRR